MTEQLFDEPGAKRLRVLLSLLFGSLMAWSQVRRIGDYLKPQTGPSPWGVIPKGSHRDIFGNRGLWPQSEAELEPGEVLLGVLDGVIGSRQIANMRMTGIICLLTPLIVIPIVTAPFGIFGRFGSQWAQGSCCWG